MIQAIAVDDEIPALNLIENFCSKIDVIQLQKTFNKPSEALKYVTNFPVDLLFLDINMPSLNGIDLFKALPQKAMVIFTTAYSEFAVQGFELNAVDYLLKPFTFERFTQAVARAQEWYKYQRTAETDDTTSLLIRANYNLHRINPADILYIEGLDDYLKIHVTNQKPIVTRMTMKAMIEKLPAKQFVRIHRSFIVPLQRIASVRNKIVLIEDKELPIGNSYEEAFFKVFNK